MIYTLMVVGPGEAARYLDAVLERAFIVSDEIVCFLDPSTDRDTEELCADYTNHVVRSYEHSWGGHEGLFRQGAWDALTFTVNPTHDDHILILDADELIVDTDAVEKAVRDYPQHRLGFLFHEMFTMSDYRTDGHWKPYPAWIMIPFRKGGRIAERAMASGREPTYAANIRRVDTPIANVLHYGYAKAADRHRKFERYMELDGGNYHSIDHLRSIIQTPQLAAWEGGGLIVETPE